jgi:flavorubredoxin
MMARIEDAFEQEGRELKVDYIIQNHVEKDHSGVLYDLWKRFDAPIYCS